MKQAKNSNEKRSDHAVICVCEKDTAMSCPAERKRKCGYFRRILAYVSRKNILEQKTRLWQGWNKKGYVNRIRQQNFWYFACYFAADSHQRLYQSHTSVEFLVVCVLLCGRCQTAMSIANVSGIFGTLRATSRQMPCGYVNRIRQRNNIIFFGTLHATSRQMPILTRAISRQVPVEPVSTN